MNKIFPLVLCGLVPAFSAFALTCQNDYGGSTSCASNTTAAGDCKTLGYSTVNVEGCKHYLYCPFDKSYKKCVDAGKSCVELGFTKGDKSSWCGKLITCDSDRTYTACVESFENPCPDGYDPRKTSVADCGSQGSNGWIFRTQTITGNNGEKITCGQCTPQTCTGYSESYKSASDCGSSGANGWLFNTCYAGETLKGRCTAKTCSNHGYRDSTANNLLCKRSSSVYLGNTLATCQDCVTCNKSTVSSNSSFYHIGSDSCLTVCGAHTSSTKGLYGAFLSDFSDRQGRSGKCYAWKNYNPSIATPSTYCCCQNKNYVSSSATSCK